MTIVIALCIIFAIAAVAIAVVPVVVMSIHEHRTVYSDTASANETAIEARVLQDA